MASSNSTSYSTDMINRPQGDDHVLRYERDKKKGYVRLNTNLGPLTIELHSDFVPKMCEKFLRHCRNGHFNGTILHQSIENFQIEWNDPKNIECSEEIDLVDKYEDDDTSIQLLHTERGIVSMANSVSNSTGPQFTITYRSCPHLNGNYTIFGRVVEGSDTLDKIEKFEANMEDQSAEAVRIENVHILVNPFQEANEMPSKERIDELDTDQLNTIGEIKRERSTRSLLRFQEAAPHSKRLKLDTVTDASIMNSLFPKIENLEYFPTEVLLHIFVTTDDIGLLNLANSSYRFECIAERAFKEKYANEYFVIDRDTESQHELYSELFSRYGSGVKAIEANGIRNIDKAHWMTQMINESTGQVEKLTFNECHFENINDILSHHKNVTDLSLQKCSSSQSSNKLELHNFFKLKKLEYRYALIENDARYDCYISTDMLTQTFRNNPGLESLRLFYPVAQWVSDIMLIIAEHLKHLKELDLMAFFESDEWHFFESEEWQIPNDFMDSVVDSLKHLKALKLAICSHHVDFMRRLGLKCKDMKKLELYYFDEVDLNNQMIEALSSFQTVEVLKIGNHEIGGGIIQSVVENLTNLRHLQISMNATSVKANIFQMMHKCQTLETITIEIGSFHPGYRCMGLINEQFFNEFNDIMKKPCGKIEFKVHGKTIGFVSKKEIVWRNKLMHWVGYESKYSSSSLNLLDLAKKSSASEKEQRSPFDLILDYLDLESLYSLSEASKRSKVLVESFVERHSQEHGMFTITDEFSSDVNGLDAFGEHVQNMKLCIFERGFIGYLASKGTTLPQVQHLVFDSYLICDFRNIFRICPQLETLESKTELILNGSLEVDTLNFHNLKKFTFKNSGEYVMNYLREMFKNTNTELIPIM